MRPTFLIVGAMKSGTDSLWEYLRTHPEIFVAATKELDFFAEELNWRLGIEWYERQFADAGDARAVGEASTSYSKAPLHQGVPGRIAAVLPDVRVIYLVRHPIERIRSQYLHQVLIGEETRPIEVAVRRDPTYVDFSRYAFQIEQYLGFLPRERILLLTSDELRRRRRETLARTFRFLGVDERWWHPAFDEEFHRTAEKRVLRHSFRAMQKVAAYRAIARVVPASVKRATEPLRTRGVAPQRAEMPDDLRRWLEDALRDDVARLRAYAAPDFDAWGLAAASRR